MKIRIAVAIDKNGKWGSGGWGEPGQITPSDQMWDAALCGDIAEGEARYWVEVEVALPVEKVPVIQGEVSRAE